MVRNYFKVATRNIMKRKLYSFINAFGLSVAIAFCLLIFMYIVDEKSFDKFHTNKEFIYRLYVDDFFQEKYDKGDPNPYRSHAYLPAGMGEVMLDELAEVENMTRYNNWGEGIMRYGDKLEKQEFLYADSGFFQMFSFEIVEGSGKGLFRDPSDVVLTRATAEKYFGNEDPIGKIFTLNIDGEKAMKVAAIIEDPPANSSLNFKMIVPIDAQPWLPRNRNQWGSFSYPTFFQVKEGTDMTLFKIHLDSLVKKYMGKNLVEWKEREQIPGDFPAFRVGFSSLNDVHMNTEVEWEKSSDPKYSLILGVIAASILLIACINYVSLALTTSAARKVEVGIRKVVGAQRRQLVYQFTTESILLALISMIIGIGLVVTILPMFNEFTGKGISLTGYKLHEAVAVIFGITMLVGILAGSYPSVFLSGFLPATVLKGRFTSRMSAVFTRPLVALQFVLSAGLIISTIIMYRQMEYVTTKDLGYDQDQVMAISAEAGWSLEADHSVERFRARAANEPLIAGVAGVSSSFNKGWSRYGYQIDGENKDAFVYRVDPSYVPLLGIELIQGRNFDERIASDSTALIVNEALVKDMGWTDPLNEHLNWREEKEGLGSKIIGVVKDYHFLSLANEIEPMFLSMDSKNVGYLSTILVKLQKGNVAEGMTKVKQIWNELFPDRPYTYSFVDEDVAGQYEVYKRWMKITGLSTTLAIVIACLGLFGLSGINAVNRTKEIGIRKVMGASLSNIFILLNKQYVILSIASFVVATPFAVWLMNTWWLKDFKFIAGIGWEIFALGLLAALFVSLLTVSYHAVKASQVNPAETLKHE